ncbi:MAG: hypothetical protein E4H16_03250 [Candidatus Atribacteria bacterium]|nr:MAG: hypothetical protein E4H16_03250 [Candidatus Atribacteria bacterium]
MNKKKGNLLELHVDKIIFAIVGILCLLLLWMFVLSSPYDVEIEPGRKVSPGEIDTIVKREAERLNDKLQGDYVPRPYAKTRSEEFQQLLECSIKDVPQVALLLPGYGEKPLTGDRKYRVPDIVDVTDVTVASIRGAAQVPEDEDEISPGNPYKTARTAVGDIDFVSVEGKIDIKSLFANFDQNFAGRKVTKLEWRDENFAKPVFAGIELQRSRKSEDGTWNEWESVPRTKIDPYKSLLACPRRRKISSMT